MHNHFCTFCGHAFDCDVPFCAGLINLMCDGCLVRPAKAEAPSHSFEALNEYIRQRAARVDSALFGVPMRDVEELRAETRKAA